MSDRNAAELRAILGLALMLLCLGLLLGLASGCSGSADGVETLGSWQYQRTTIGERTEVRTVAGSVWGGPARLVEEVTIGSADGPEEHLFGIVAAVAAYRDRIYVLDSRIPVVRVYDEAGSHLQDIGREGDGPGEFRSPQSLAVDPRDGTVYVRGRGRIEKFTPAGDFVGRHLTSGTFSTSRPMVMTESGRIYTMQLLNPGSDLTEWQMGMIWYAPEGTPNDTIRAPEFGFDEWEVIARSENNTSSTSVPYGPDELWTMASSGAMVGGVNDDFSFEVRGPDGSVTVISKVWEPIPVPSAEAAWLKKRVTENFREDYPGWTWNGPGVPSTKPAYTSLIPDRSGRVWVAVHGPSERIEDCAQEAQDSSDYYRRPCWKEQGGWLLFSADGQFLGEVEVPEEAQITSSSWIEGDTVLTRATGEDGTPYVKRYRLVTP